MWTDALIGAASAFVIALVTTPVGVSGAVFLVPLQVSVLHTPSPSVTPTNLLYNVIATPGALLRYRGRAILRSPLTRVLLVGTIPGVIAGSVIRIEVLSGPQAFYLVIAAVMLPSRQTMYLVAGMWQLISGSFAAVPHELCGTTKPASDVAAG